MTEPATKGDQIREMFIKIAPRYDFLNRLLSLGIDRRWRQAAAENIRSRIGGQVIDIATGTGEMALEVANATDESVKIIGVDFCAAMVDYACTKIKTSAHSGRVALGVASCDALPFRNEAFDSATIAFGIRNVVDRRLGLQEICRILQPGGRIVVLEFSTPRSRFFKTFYHFYFQHLLPAIGSIFSDSNAYRYLPDSVMEFYDRDTFKKLMIEAGFENVSHTDYSCGIVTCYLGDKTLTASLHTPQP
jgi:demethylmenaquinone methyltransferase/2-methoxy-6-polyprenyl-1,4-benzoquinol methylase